MKLITEYTQNDIQCMVTEEKGGKKNYVIEGVFAQAEKENRNKRFYPKSVLEPAIEKFVKEQVTTNRAVGELIIQKVQQLIWIRFHIASPK